MKYLYRVYQWLVAAPILLVVTVVTAIVTTIGSVIDSDWWGYYPSVWWSRCWCALLLVHVSVVGREHISASEPYVFVANHQGAFDIFVISGYLGHRFKWMMRKGLTNIPLIGTACRSAGHIMVDTHSAHGLAATMSQAEAALDRGCSLVIFPEGRRTDDGTMGRFKPGAFKLATEFNRAIVPITIDGAYRVMPRNTFNVTPGRITITIHEPIHPTEGSHDLDAVASRCRDAISSALT